MSCNTKAVFDRPIGGNGEPFITTPFGLREKNKAKIGNTNIESATGSFQNL